jgi:protein TonB
MAAFYKTMEDEFKYPKEAKDKEVTGKVFVEFVVNEEGLLSNVGVLKGIGSGCDEEAIRIVMKSSKTCPWRPAKRNGVIIKTRFVVPVKFGVK